MLAATEKNKPGLWKRECWDGWGGGRGHSFNCLVRGGGAKTESGENEECHGQRHPGSPVLQKKALSFWEVK